MVNKVNRIIKAPLSYPITLITSIPKIVGLFLISISCFKVSAQEEKQLNLPKYDKASFQFGFTLGLNTGNMPIEQVADFHYIDSAYDVQTISQSGFNIGIVATKQFGSFFDLRFAPSLSFVERDLQYTLIYPDTSSQQELTTSYVTKQLQSTYLEFPFDFKYKSKRLNNFRSYVLAGGKYAIDMISQAQVQSNDKEIVKLQRIDYGYEVGVGFDFFMEYFKFGIEAKMYTGLPNLLVKDNRYIYTSSIDQLHNKTFLFSLYFEGGKN